MPNPEHAALVLQLEDWNKWRKESPNLKPDLIEANLRGAYLNGASLSRTDLRGADLALADLRGADLRRASLDGADLARADLTEANLSGADLRGAKLSQADLSVADLRGADLREADLREADLARADLSEADLSGAYLSDANLKGANLCGANLTEARLGETIFGNTNLRDAKGLAGCVFFGPCTLDHRSLQISGILPLPFLRGCGLPDRLIEYLPSLLNEAVQFFSCFISYSHSDKAFARRLFDTLQGNGIRCWLDEKQLLPGDHIYDQVDRGIRIWDKVLLCCSKQSLAESWWVNSEIERAFKKEQALMKERGQKVLALIPLDLDGYLLSGQWRSGLVEPVLTRFVADFRGWNRSHKKFEAQVELVIRALRADEKARPPAPEPKL